MLMLMRGWLLGGTLLCVSHGYSIGKSRAHGVWEAVLLQQLAKRSPVEGCLPGEQQASGQLDHTSILMWVCKQLRPGSAWALPFNRCQAPRVLRPKAAGQTGPSLPALLC